jgi:hypothetical protein
MEVISMAAFPLRMYCTGAVAPLMRLTPNGWEYELINFKLRELNVAVSCHAGDRV